MLMARCECQQHACLRQVYTLWAGTDLRDFLNPLYGFMHNSNYVDVLDIVFPSIF